MNVMEAITSRCSVRRFRPDAVPDEAVRRLIEAARRAPSAGNIQPWHFYVVKDEAKRGQLARAALGQRFVAEAPLCLVVCAEPAASARVYRERGAQLYCLQDTAAAVQNILLAALELGLGTCWVGAFDEEQVRRVLGIPQERRAVALIPVGYPAAETGRPTSRKEVEEICTWV